MQTDPVNEFFKANRPPEDQRSAYDCYPRMLCADGFSMSVQGHQGSYSSPRIAYADHYATVEVGFPSERDDLLMPYAETPTDPTGTVYGYVPVEVIKQVLAKHGGLAGPQTKPRKSA